MVDVHDDPLELVSSRYDAWRAAYGAERSRVLDALRERGLADRVERIEHVGSTAVPNLAAKDVVDLDVVVDGDAVGEVAAAVEGELGGTRAVNGDDWQPVFREHDGQRFNDHVFAAASDGWRVSVVTRDVLRERPALREAYERLKRDLASEHDDLEAYSRGKTAFVERLLAAARDGDDLAFGFDVPDEVA